jgi:O-methyltransferase involved in polyketide biosynthesis
MMVCDTQEASGPEEKETPMSDQQRIASIADASKPNAGRIYDFVLGGNHNFDVDRAAAQHILKLIPDYPQLARFVRWFLGEAVRRLAEEGHRHFIDFASGLPTVDHIHQITPAGTKVVYSDLDPVTVAYGQEIIKDLPDVRYVACNAAKPESILTSSLPTELFGSNRKVVFGLNGVAFFLTDEQIAYSMKTLYDWADKGSRLFICDSDIDPSQGNSEGMKLWEKMGQPFHFRSNQDLQKLVAPWGLGEGFKSIQEWVGVSMRDEDKKSPYADILKGAILEK